MRRLMWLLTLGVLTAALVGCSSDKERGMNRSQDKPQSGDSKDK
jgi:hypothetical protein